MSASHEGECPDAVWSLCPECGCCQHCPADCGCTYCPSKDCGCNIREAS